MDGNYKEYVKNKAKKSHIFIDCLNAFWVGGLICIIGQLFSALYNKLNVPEESVKMLVPVSLIFITALLTGIGIYDKIAKFGGAGTLVPITGFANAMTSPAIDNKVEGWILGLGAKMFTITGPVILYGTLASVIYGIIYYIFSVVV